MRFKLPRSLSIPGKTANPWRVDLATILYLAAGKVPERLD